MWHLFDRYKGVVWPKARQLNLIAKILNNLCAGPGIKLDTPTVPSPASPVTIGIDTEWIDEYIEGAGGIKPWTVRWHEPPSAEEGGTQPDGQWEVFLPPGTLTIRSSCYVINDPSSNTTGHDDEANWYKIPLNEGSASGETKFRIVAHGKPSVMMKAGIRYTQEKPFVSVTAVPESMADPTADRDFSTHYFGDIWNTVIATVTVERKTSNNVTTVTRSVLQVAKAAVNVNADTPTYFRPVFQMTWSGNYPVPLTLDHLYLEDRTIYVGGVATVAPNSDLNPPLDYCRIYLTIDTTGGDPVASLSVRSEGPDAAPLQSTADEQNIILFLLYNKRVTSDFRANLANLPYYRGLS